METDDKKSLLGLGTFGRNFTIYAKETFVVYSFHYSSPNPYWKVVYPIRKEFAHSWGK